jgi:hypothetical protein
MADPFLTELYAISRSGTSAQDFLRRLGSLHARWHVAHNGGTAGTGFLVFHWELMSRFTTVGGPAFFGGVTAFSLQDLTRDHAQYNVADIVSTSDVMSLEHFSGDLEAWHNDAHMNIGMAIHKNLMNPRTNVRIAEFWRLHTFINDRFNEQLAKYTPGTSLPDAVRHLEGLPTAPLI